MKLNKILLNALLILSILTSCNPDSEIKIKGLKIEANELLYACSQERSVNFNFGSASCEYIDNVTAEYFTFDTESQVLMQGINISKIEKNG